MSIFRLDGKTALITGGGSGIGLSICEVFARQGARVLVADLDFAAAQRAAATIRAAGGEAHAYACDVADGPSVGRVFDAARREHGGVRILVNNAGIAHVGSVEKTTDEDLDRLYRVNVKGTFHGLKAGVQQMLELGGGAILNLASIASVIGMKDRFAYSMSKGAVYSMTLSVAMDYVDKGIRCNCVLPARIHTPFVDGYLKKNYPGHEPEMFQKLSEYQPIGRMGKPEEVAHLALYLCSDEAAFVTGSAYAIDGGVIKLV